MTIGKGAQDANTICADNHKPSFPATDARLKPSLPGKTTSYDLSFPSPEGTVGFAGTRSTDDDDYVLWFDPERKAFVLDKVDSTFNMNLTRIPGNSNPEELRRRYPHLESGQSQKAGDKKNAANKDKSKATPKGDEKGSITVHTKEAMQRKLDKKTTDKKSSDRVLIDKKKPLDKKSLLDKKPVGDKNSVDKQPLEKKPLDKKSAEKRSLEKKIFERKQLDKKLPKKVDLALPTPQPPKPAQPESRKKKDDDDDEEDEDDDGDLLIEYPGAENPARQTHFSPSFPAPRRFDDFMDQRESEVEEEEEDNEDDDGGMDPDTDFKLPSPVKNASQTQSEAMDLDEDEEDGAQGEGEEEEGEEGEGANEAADLELDLEQELENAFEKLESNDQDSGNNGYYYSNNADDDESEISEED